MNEIKMPMISEVEETKHLAAEEKELVNVAAKVPFRTVEQAATFLLIRFPGWMVHKGGHHVALHRQAGDDKRVLIIREPKLAAVKSVVFTFKWGRRESRTIQQLHEQVNDWDGVINSMELSQLKAELYLGKTTGTLPISSDPVEWKAC